MSTYKLCFEQKYENYQTFSSEICQFLVVKFSIYLNRRVFVIWAHLTHSWLKASVQQIPQTIRPPKV